MGSLNEIFLTETWKQLLNLQSGEFPEYPSLLPTITRIVFVKVSHFKWLAGTRPFTEKGGNYQELERYQVN